MSGVAVARDVKARFRRRLGANTPPLKHGAVQLADLACSALAPRSLRNPAHHRGRSETGAEWRADRQPSLTCPPPDACAETLGYCVQALVRCRC